MNTDNRFDGNHYITAQVIIKADNFAKEMLGEEPTPQKMGEFIRDNASLMEVVYGTVAVEHKDALTPDMRRSLRSIDHNVATLLKDTEFIMRTVTNVDIALMFKPKPWYKRILGL